MNGVIDKSKKIVKKYIIDATGVQRLPAELTTEQENNGGDVELTLLRETIVFEG